MGTVTDRYNVPKSWDDLDSTWIENGDYAGWVDAIRFAMMERVDVCLDGYQGTALRNLVTSLGYFEKTPASMTGRVPYGYRGDAEIYEFARRTTILLDFLLTPYHEFGTADNTVSPWGERGYFLDQDPNYWLKRTDYADDISETGRSTMCYAKYLNLERMFEDDERNYQLALSGVARGDTPDKFVPFFNAVKKALNYMTVIPIIGNYEVDARTTAWPLNYRTVEEVHDAMTNLYNDDMGSQPKPESLTDSVFSINIEHYCRITNYAEPTDTRDSYGGRMRYKYVYPYQIKEKLPPLSFNYYYAYWAEKLPDEGGENSFTWSAEYTPGHHLVGKIDGEGHFLGGDSGKHFGSRFPTDNLTFPSTPPREQTNVAGYNMTLYHIADFNVEGGFKFRDTGA